MMHNTIGGWRMVVGVLVGAMVLAAPAAAGGQSDLADARRATARFHDPDRGASVGYVSTLDQLGCFENPAIGGMGVHHLDPSLLDGTVDATAPEALVYELQADGGLRLVALEYLVPAELVDPDDPPELFGQHFHPHGVLPFWILHAWIWRPNPRGTFTDFNPRVGMCPDGVPVFGR